MPDALIASFYVAAIPLAYFSGSLSHTSPVVITTPKCSRMIESDVKFMNVFLIYCHVFHGYFEIVADSTGHDTKPQKQLHLKEKEER